MWYIFFSKKNLIEQIRILINIDLCNPNDFKLNTYIYTLYHTCTHTHIHVCVFYITHTHIYVCVCVYDSLLLTLDVQIQDIQL